MENPIVKILYPGPDFLVTQAQLEKASTIGVEELYRLACQHGIFLKPGVMVSDIVEDKLMPHVVQNGLVVTSGIGVTSTGSVIYVQSNLNVNINLSDFVNKTLFIKYDTEITSDLVSRTPSSGFYTSVTVRKSQDPEAILFWVDNYRPEEDPDLTLYPDAIPIGKLIQMGGEYSFDVGNGHRRIALLKIPFMDQGHYNNEFVPSVKQYASIYGFLSCVGHGTRATNNPFGLTTTDIEHCVETFRALIHTAGIPVSDFTNDVNKDYLLVSFLNDYISKVVVNKGVAIDWNGRRLYVANQQLVNVPNDGIWYYLAIKYLDSSGKDYYEFTLTETNYGQVDRINLARVKNVGGVVEVIDQRQVLLCRGYYPEPSTPGVPTNLVLTTGYEDSLIHKADIDDDYGEGASDSMIERRAGNIRAYIKATWTASTGDVVAFEVLIQPLDNYNNPIPEMQSIGYGLSSDTSFTFSNLCPGIKYRIKVRAVGRPPHSLRSAFSPHKDIIAGVGANLLMSPITLTERYSEVPTTRYQSQGIEISWSRVLGAYAYEIFGRKNVPPDISTVEGRDACEFRWVGNSLKCFCPAVDGEHWYFQARCFDSGGFPSKNKIVADIEFGDIIPPSIPDKLALTTGMMEDLIPIDEEQSLMVNVPSPGLAYIRATWKPSVDNKSGVVGYETWIAPAKKLEPNEPDDDLMEVRTAYTQSNAPPCYYTFLNLKPGLRYFVKVRAIDGRGNISDWSEIKSIVAGMKVKPVKPIPIARSATNSVEISWDLDENAQGYEVFCRENGDPGVNPDRIYLYALVRSNKVVYSVPSTGTTGYSVTARVRAFNSTGEYSDISDPVTASPVVIDANTFLSLKNEVETARGSALSLGQRLDIGLTNDGRIKAVTEIESEVADARSGFATIGERISALYRGQIDWRFVRVVAKSGGNYNSIQAAIDSIPESSSDRYLILVMNSGWYYEAPNYYNYYSEESGKIEIKGKYVGVLGIGNPLIYNTYIITTESDAGVMGKLWYLGGLTMISNDYSPLSYLRNDRFLIIENCSLFCNNLSAIGIKVGQLGTDNNRIKVRNCAIKSGYKGIDISVSVCVPLTTFYLEVNNTNFECNDECIYISACQETDVKVWLWDSILKTVSADYTVNAGVNKSFVLCMAHNRYNKLPNESAITVKYGQIESGKVSNVKYDTGDLGVIF